MAPVSTFMLMSRFVRLLGHSVEICEDFFMLVTLMSQISNIHADHVVFDRFVSILI